MLLLPRRLALPLVLVVGLCLTGIVAWRAERAADERRHLAFVNASAQLTSAIEARVENYLSLLRGARGLLDDPAVRTRERFAAYVESLNVPENYPGVQGVGFAERVAQKPGPDVVSTGFTVWPDEDQGDAFVVALLEPPDSRNRRAMGYNMYADPVRRAAMDRAAELVGPAATGRVTLVQEIDERKQSGFLIYLPVYEAGDVTADPERPRLPAGYAFSPFRADDLFAGIFRGRSARDIEVRVYDGDSQRTEALLHTSTLESPATSGQEQIIEQVRIAGHPWTVVYTNIDPAQRSMGTGIGVSLVGLALTGLLGLLVHNLERERAETARHAAQLEASEQAARDNQRLKQAILDAALDGIVTVDRGGTILDINPAAEALLGHSRQEALGQNLAKLLLPSASRAAGRRELEREFNTGSGTWVGRRLEVVAQRTTGDSFPVEVTISRVEVRGQPIFTAYLRDITERRHAEARISELNENLEERVHLRTVELKDANQQLESFSYSVSHDLRAPARHVLGFSELLRKRLEKNPDPEAQRLVGVITESARRMAQLIDDLLSFSRTSRQEFQRARVSMSELVTEALRALAPELEERRVEWEISPLPEVDGDRALLAQVWANLLSNAVKYTRQCEVARIRITARVTEKETIFQVADNGIGFDMAYVDKLFGVFQRLHPPQEFEGTGIGLANVARIIHRHGGRVEAFGEPQAGARFTFALPRTFE